MAATLFDTEPKLKTKSQIYRSMKAAAKSLRVELERRGVSVLGIGFWIWHKRPALLVSFYNTRRDWQKLPQEWNGWPVAHSTAGYDDRDIPREERDRCAKYYTNEMAY